MSELIYLDEICRKNNGACSAQPSCPRRKSYGQGGLSRPSNAGFQWVGFLRCRVCYYHYQIHLIYLMMYIPSWSPSVISIILGFYISFLLYSLLIQNPGGEGDYFLGGRIKQCGAFWKLWFRYLDQRCGMEYKARRAWEDQTMRLVCHTEEGRLYTKGLSETWYIYSVEYHSAIE